jgi:hypothetical protein
MFGLPPRQKHRFELTVGALQNGISASCFRSNLGSVPAGASARLGQIERLKPERAVEDQ